MRFGLDTPDNELDGRELMLLRGALGAQMRYVRNLAEKNRDEEAKGRNLVNLLELQILDEKLRRAS